MLNVKVDTAPLATHTGSCILYFEVLLKSNITPVWNLDWSCGFCENNLWICMFEWNHKEFKRKWFYVFVWPKHQTWISLLYEVNLAVTRNFWPLYLYFKWLLQNFVRRKEVRVFTEVKRLNVWDVHVWWVCNNSSLMKLKNLKMHLWVFATRYQITNRQLKPKDGLVPTQKMHSFDLKLNIS